MLKTFLYFFVLSFLLVSCGQKFSLQKRKYNKGFYISAGRTISKGPECREEKKTTANEKSRNAKELIDDNEEFHVSTENKLLDQPDPIRSTAIPLTVIKKTKRSFHNPRGYFDNKRAACSTQKTTDEHNDEIVGSRKMSGFLTDWPYVLAELIIGGVCLILFSLGILTLLQAVIISAAVYLLFLFLFQD